MEAVEIQTGSKPAASIIWLHGLGADGHDFEPIVPELKLAKPVRFVFPHAPVRPVTINQGMRMRAWYDILQFGGGPEDEAGIRASQRLVEELISKEKKNGMPAAKIVMAGFSQGGYAARNQTDASFLIFDFLGDADDHCCGAAWAGCAADCALSRFGPKPRAISDSEPSLPSGVRFWSA